MIYLMTKSSYSRVSYIRTYVIRDCYNAGCRCGSSLVLEFQHHRHMTKAYGCGVRMLFRRESMANEVHSSLITMIRPINLGSLLPVISRQYTRVISFF